MTVRKKPQEETAMEKRNTAIINFILVALVPLLLMIFLGFSLKKGNLQNEENLSQKFVDLSNKHEALNQHILDLVSMFNSADTIFDNLDKKDYEDLLTQVAEIESDITLDGWDRRRADIIGTFEQKINKIRDDRQLKHDDELQPLLVLSANWLKEIAYAKNDELSLQKLRRVQELKRIEIEGSPGVTDVQTLQMQLMEKDFELTRSQDAKVKSETDAQLTNSALQRKYDQVLKVNTTVKTEIEAELTAINGDILPELEGGIFKGDDVRKLRDKLRTKVDNIGKKTGSLKTDD